MTKEELLSLWSADSWGEASTVTMLESPFRACSKTACASSWKVPWEEEAPEIASIVPSPNCGGYTESEVLAMPFWERLVRELEELEMKSPR